MRHRHTKLVAATSALLLSLASTAGAVVLWDQSNWNTNGEGSLNLSSTSSCSQLTGNTRLHTASDVTFPQPVTITHIRIYESPGNVQAATQAYLWIEPKTGPLPTALNTTVNNAANLVSITNTTEVIGSVTTVIVTAAVNINLPAGSYWVSLTPRHNRGSTFPWTVHRVTTGPIIGHPTAHIDACPPTVHANWSYPLDPPTYDYAIKIEGDFPVPAVQSSWGKVKTIYR